MAEMHHGDLLRKLSLCRMLRGKRYGCRDNLADLMMIDDKIAVRCGHGAIRYSGRRVLFWSRGQPLRRARCECVAGHRKLRRGSGARVQVQVWGHTPEQRVAASTLRRYSFGLRLAIAQADARPDRN